jgi:hypothetical protein
MPRPRSSCVLRDAHQSGTLEDAETIITRYPFVPKRNIYAAALVGDEAAAAPPAVKLH